MSYFMEHFLKECLHSEGNNSKLKLWLQKYIKQKLKYKIQWKTIIQGDCIICLSEPGERNSQKNQLSTQ